MAMDRCSAMSLLARCAVRPTLSFLCDLHFLATYAQA